MKSVDPNMNFSDAVHNESQALQFWKVYFDFAYWLLILIGEAHLKSPSPFPASFAGFGHAMGAHFRSPPNWAGMGSGRTNGFGLGRPQ